jgi:RNA polymerase sigma-70 factor (ECF subfamily)
MAGPGQKARAVRTDSNEDGAVQTCWTMIQAAARGDRGARADFAGRYVPVVRAALAARWKGSPFLREIEDAVQDIFVECFRVEGAIERADPSWPGGFRAYLRGVVQNIVARVERRAAQDMHKREPKEIDAGKLVAADTRLSVAFDRAWARSIMREAGALHASTAKAQGAAAEKRLQILRLRFEEGLPIRDIAPRIGMEPSVAHHEYARARKEFRAALNKVVAYYRPGSAEDVDRECEELLHLLK